MSGHKKITPANYMVEADKIDFSKLPAHFKEAHIFTEKAIFHGAHSSAKLKPTIDAYLSELNERLSKELKERTATTALKMKHKAAEDNKKAPAKAAKNKETAKDIRAKAKMKVVKTPAKKDGPTVHYCTENDTIYVDTPFVQNSNNAIVNAELKHYGGGDFGLTGAVTMKFIRTDKKLPGFTGRTHRVSGDKVDFGDLLTKMRDMRIDVVDTKAAKKKAPAKAAKKKGPAKAKVTPAAKAKAKKELTEMKGQGAKGDFKKYNRDQVLAMGQYFEKTRSLLARSIDEGSDNKNRLTPTPENLVRWMNNPGKFDLIGVDTFKKGDATANLKINKEVFWKRLLNRNKR